MYKYKFLIVAVALLTALIAACTPIAQQSGTDSDVAFDDGLIIITSNQAFDDTVTSLTDAVEAAGFRVPLVLDHSANAASVDLELPPTTLIIFGNPAVGTGLMQNQRSIGLDLPQKFLVWEDEGAVFIAYNDPAFLAQRHGLTEQDDTIEQIASALANFAEAGANGTAQDDS